MKKGQDRERVVGPANQTTIVFNGINVTALIDTGSMVSTASQSFYESLKDKPELLDVSLLGIDVTIADGSKLDILGYIETSVFIPVLSDFTLDVPILIVPDSSLNRQCPVIVGTNIIRRCKSFVNSSASFDIPDVWQCAFDSLTCHPCMVRSTNNRTIEVGPYETTVLNGIVRGANCDSCVTENIDSNEFLVSPQFVKITPSTSYSKVPVKICNISAKPLRIRPISNLCQINEASVVDNLASFHSDDCDSSSCSSASESESDSCMSEPEQLGLKIDKENITPEQLHRVRQVLGNWPQVFSKGLTDIGRCNLVKHKIVLTDDRPFKQPYRKIPASMYEEVKQHIKDMLDCGVIRPSDSPYSSNVVLVRKKDGSLRFCIDHRMLNARTRKDAYMLPRFDDTVDVLAGSKFFSKLDLRSAYWQVEIEEEDKYKTAFSVGNLGFWEMERMSYGLTNAPSTFQRLSERCMGDMLLRDCLVFIDDILVFSRTFGDHLDRLEAVFSRLQDNGLKLKPSKCELFKTSVEYLGHVISQEGIHTDPAKTSAVTKWPVPTNVKELRSFLGFTGYYRRFVKNYAQIAQPLNRLLEGHPTSKSKRSKAKPPIPWQWGPEQQLSFDTLKTKLTEPPILAIADFSLPFVVHCDASLQGLGGVLIQVIDGKERVIAYASRGLRPAEKHYPIHKLEFLALKWCITDKFHDYLYGNEFVVKTDNNPLTYVLSSAKLDAAQHRWVASLATYNFTIEYKAGSTNSDVKSSLTPSTPSVLLLSLLFLSLMFFLLLLNIHLQQKNLPTMYKFHGTKNNGKISPYLGSLTSCSAIFNRGRILHQNIHQYRDSSERETD